MKLKALLMMAVMAVAALGANVALAAGKVPTESPTPYPAVGRQAEVRFEGGVTFLLSFADDSRMSFVGTEGAFKGVTDTVEYTAREIRPNVYMVYWHEPSTGANVVHVQDYENGVVYTNIAQPSGQFLHMKGSLRLLDGNK